MTVKPACRRLRHRRRTFNMGKGNQNDSADPRLERGCQQMPKPARVGLREKARRTWSEEPASKVDDHVCSLDRGRQRRRSSKVRLDWTNIRKVRQVLRQRSAVIHQAELMPGRRKLARESTAKVACGSRDENRATVSHRVFPARYTRLRPRAR